MKKIYLIFITIINAFGNYNAQIKDNNFFIYGGPTFGTYRFAQAPLDYRAWEFNNYVGVKKEMKSNKSFSGMHLGTIFPFHKNANNKLGFVVAGEFCRTNNRMKGERDSLGAVIERKFNQRTTSFYFGIGACGPKRNKKGELKKFTFGYIFYFCRSFYRLTDKTTINKAEVPEDNVTKDRLLNCKNLLYFNYAIDKNIKVGVYPYIENHVFDNSVAPLVEIMNGRANYFEHYNLKNFGANICLVIGI